MSSRDVIHAISTEDLPSGEHVQGSSSSPPRLSSPGPKPPPLYTTASQQQHETGSHPSSERTSAPSTFQGTAESTSLTLCSILTWGNATVGEGQQQQQVAYFEHRPLVTPDELQNEIASLITTQDDVPPATAAIGAFVTTAQEQQQQGAAQRKPLIVLRGLSTPFVSALLKSPLGMDPAFVKAHAGGRRYRPRGVNRLARDDGTTSSFAHWDYPELVTGYSKHAVLEGGCWSRPGSAIRPVPRPVSDVDRGLAAVFCRASLWRSAGKGPDVLFLDEPAWQRPGSSLQKARERWQVIATPETEGEEEGREKPNLEDTLHETMMMMDGGGDGGALPDVLEQTAYDHWLDFFEVLTPGRESDVDSERISLEWRVMEALERNADMKREVSRRRKGSASPVPYADWESLIRRLRLRVEILSTMPPKLKVPTPKPSRRRLPVREESFVPIPAPRHSVPAKNNDGPSSGGGDENQRALDRVTYLGGILLPFSIVSGILSMNEDFEPGSPLFWVFWVAAVPLAVFTILLINADKLRRAEVWVAVSVKGEDSSSDGGSKSDGKGRKEELEEEVARKRRRFRPEPRIAEPETIAYAAQPEAVTYGGMEDVVIDLGTPDVTTEPQTISLEPPTSIVEPPPPPPVAPRPGVAHEQAEEQTGEEDDGGLMVIPAVEDTGMKLSSKPGHHSPTWRKQQLGWGGAAMCMLGLRKPSRVSEGMPDGASGLY